MITVQALEAAGYRKHRHYEEHCGYALWQKLVNTAEGIRLYGIEAYFWEFPPSMGGPSFKRVEMESRLYLPEGNALVGSTGFMLQVHCSDEATVEAVEAFIATAHKTLGCGLDPHNQ